LSLIVHRTENTNGILLIFDAMPSSGVGIQIPNRIPRFKIENSVSRPFWIRDVIISLLSRPQSTKFIVSLILARFRMDPNESSTVYKEVYNLLPRDVFVAYDKLQNFARE
jgi:hypothetical protein